LLLTSGIGNQQFRVSKTGQTEAEKFKAQLIYLFPILISLDFGLSLAYLLQPLPPPPAQTITPVPPSTPGAPIYDGFYFVILIAIGAAVFYLLLKHRNKRVITGLITVSMTAAAALLSIIYLDALAQHFSVLFNFEIPLTIVITVLFVYSILRAGPTIRNLLIIFLGGALGVFLGRYLPFYSAIVILSFLAVYDIIAVYKGPVGKIAESASGLDDLRGLSYSFKDIQMGLGDLVFYSMLAATIFFTFDIAACLVSIMGILVGTVITLYMLEKRDIFPGLPFPILLGLAGGLITGFLIMPLL
jgi:presenilin-like A22 family membrane protease